jgi:hypothetical protein
MVLICGKKDVNKIIKLGKLNIDDYGRVDISYEYDIENIADTGIAAEKIIGAAIVKFLDTNVVSVMSGFSTTDKPSEWRSYKLADFKNQKEEKEETRTEDITNEFDEYEQNIELIKIKNEGKLDEVVERIETQSIENKGTDDKERINVETIETVKIADKLQENILVNVPEEEVEIDRHKHKKEDKDDKCNDKEDDHHKDNKYHKEYDNVDYPKGSMGDFFKAVAQDFEEMHDFTKEIKWCKWYKVPVPSLESLYDFSDYNKYTIAYYPMICYYPYIRNTKSFMLGYKCDSSGKMKYIVYGIPGSRAKVHQPFGGKTGFVTWIPDKKNDEMGYWLMFYDFKKSMIVVPLKK